MAPSYWQPDWFDQSYFPAVWFAPADETGVPVEELRPEYYGGGGAQIRRQYHDATEDDVRRMVLDKWEAAEASTPQAKADTSPASLPAGTPASQSDSPTPDDIAKVDELAARRAARRRDDEEALLLILAQL